MEIEKPKVGQVWVRDGLQREIVEVRFRGRHERDYDITWRRPGSEKLVTVWLPYWKTWRNKASMVVGVPNAGVTSATHNERNEG